MKYKLKKGGTIKLQYGSKIQYDNNIVDWIPSALENTQSIQNSFQLQADNTAQGYLRKKQKEIEDERRNMTLQQRILEALNTASNTQNQYGLTNQAVQDRLTVGDIPGATDIAKTGLTGVGLGYLASSTLPLVSSAIADFGTYGALGGLGKQGGMYLGGYLLDKGVSEIGKGVDSLFNTGKVFETGLGLAGGLAGFGWGNKTGYTLAKNILAKRMATKGINSVPNWIATNAMKRDLINDAFNAGWRYNPTNYKKLPAWASNYEKPIMQYGSFTPATATNASWEKFLSKTPQEQDAIVNYWNGENYKNFNMIKYNRRALDAFKRWWAKK